MQVVKKSLSNKANLLVLNRNFNNPMPGDFVLVGNSSQPNVPTGTFGVILGSKNNFKVEYNVCFNPVPCPWGGRTSDLAVTAAGGSTYPISTSLLKETALILEKEFLSISPNLHSVRRNVKVWQLDLNIYIKSGALTAFVKNSMKV